MCLILYFKLFHPKDDRKHFISSLLKTVTKTMSNSKKCVYSYSVCLSVSVCVCVCLSLSPSPSLPPPSHKISMSNVLQTNTKAWKFALPILSLSLFLSQSADKRQFLPKSCLEFSFLLFVDSIFGLIYFL